jgi:sterol desaturase/sphingolipid hydroxylase (fatty acid hydroxylase superfamily)
MNRSNRLQYLRLSLQIIGAIFIFAVYPLTIYWPSGWAWHSTGTSHYLTMIIGIYATLGVFLFVAAKDPVQHRSLIWFTVWSSVVHGGIMGVQAIMSPEHIGHLYGDVPALFLVAIWLGLLMPKG